MANVVQNKYSQNKYSRATLCFTTKLYVISHYDSYLTCIGKVSVTSREISAESLSIYSRTWCMGYTKPVIVLWSGMIQYSLRALCFSVFKIWDNLAQLLPVARTRSQVAKTTRVGVWTRHQTDSLNESLHESLTLWIILLLTLWVNLWLSEWICDWLSESFSIWLSEWISDSLNHSLSDSLPASQCPYYPS